MDKKLSDRYTGQHILLVEDNFLIAAAEKHTIEKAGYTVTLAHSGEEAVDFFRDGSWTDLVLMDINLGGSLEGPEAAEQILADHDIPIMFLSSHTEPEVVERTEGITSYGYIVKNSGDTVLLASIRMAFRLHEARCTVKKHSAMQALILKISRQLAAMPELQTILQTASDRLSELCGMNTGAVYLLEEEWLVLHAATPSLPPDVSDSFLKSRLKDHAHIARAISEQKPWFVTDITREPLTEAEQEIVTGRKLKSIYYLPLVSREKAIGIYMAGSMESVQELTEETAYLCETLANITAVAAENVILKNCCT